MTDDTPISILPLSEVRIGNYVLETVDARAVHSCLKVSKNFADWIKEKIEIHNFLENKHFVVLRRSGREQEPSVDFAITLDVVRRLAAAERSKRLGAGRRHERRSRRQRDRRAPTGYEIATIDERIRAVVSTMLAEGAIAFRVGMTAGQIWIDNGYPPRLRLIRWFSHRLLKAGCAIEGGLFGQLGKSRARMFDPDKALWWLKYRGGDAIVKKKILEKQGQGKLNLVMPLRA